MDESREDTTNHKQHHTGWGCRRQHPGRGPAPLSSDSILGFRLQAAMGKSRETPGQQEKGSGHIQQQA